jgi:hypothetical protein
VSKEILSFVFESWFESLRWPAEGATSLKDDRDVRLEIFLPFLEILQLRLGLAYFSMSSVF